MKNNFKQLILPLLALSFLCIFESCTKEGAVTETVTAQEQEADFVADSDHFHKKLTGDETTRYKGAIEEHVEGHGVNLETVERVVMERPDGSAEHRVLVDGCISMSEEELHDIMEMTANNARQYRTFNLVSPQVVTVIGYTGGSYALSSKMRTALRWAINNYNALGLNLTFQLSYGARTNADIVVYQSPTNTGAGGVAGFPSGGQPYKWVQIYRGMENYNTNVNEHVMTHEIGHCLGLRHTDYFNRASCGQNSNEGGGSIGAVHIPGTPTGTDLGSVMLACFSSNEDGEFGPYDAVALRYLY